MIIHAEVSWYTNCNCCFQSQQKMSQLDVKDHSRLYSGSSNWNFQRETIPIAEDRVSERVGK